MNQNIHAFVQQSYQGSLYRAAERLADKELDERIRMYDEEKRQVQLKKDSRLVERALNWCNEESKGPREFLVIPLLPFYALEVAYDALFSGTPLILDNVSPLVNPEDAYKAAVEVRNFRREHS